MRLNKHVTDASRSISRWTNTTPSEQDDKERVILKCMTTFRETSKTRYNSTGLRSLLRLFRTWSSAIVSGGRVSIYHTDAKLRTMTMFVQQLDDCSVGPLIEPGASCSWFSSSSVLARVVALELHMLCLPPSLVPGISHNFALSKPGLCILLL